MSREAFEAWALRNTSLPSAHDMAWAAWQAALAQQQAEPIAWGMLRADGLVLDVICPDEHEAFAGEYTIPLYATPQQAQPAPSNQLSGNSGVLNPAPAVQPLTDEKIKDICKQLPYLPHATVFARAIEQAHGIGGPRND